MYIATMALIFIKTHQNTILITLGSIEDGEWLQYTINVSKSGSYNFNIYCCFGAMLEGKISISSNGQLLAKEVDVPLREISTTWQSVHVKNIHLQQAETG